MCAQIKVWSCLLTDTFGLFTEITVCKFMRDLVIVCPENILYIFSASFCTVHCAPELARDYAP